MSGLPWNPTLVILDKILAPLFYNILNLNLNTTRNSLQFAIASHWHYAKKNEMQFSFLLSWVSHNYRIYSLRNFSTTGSLNWIKKWKNGRLPPVFFKERFLLDFSTSKSKSRFSNLLFFYSTDFLYNYWKKFQDNIFLWN